MASRNNNNANNSSSSSVFRSFHQFYALDTSRVLGTGGYAVVRRAVHKQSGKQYAVKIMKLGKAEPEEEEEEEDGEEDEDEDSDEDSDEEDDDDHDSRHSARYDMTMSYEEIMNEIEMVARLSEHPNIVKYHEYFINPASLGGAAAEENTKKEKEASCEGDGDGDGGGGGGGGGRNGNDSGDGGSSGDEDSSSNPSTLVYIVMDLLEGPTLLDALSSLGGRYTEEDVKAVMGRLLDAVHFMHLNGVVHRDLKLENLILAEKLKLPTTTTTTTTNTHDDNNNNNGSSGGSGGGNGNGGDSDRAELLESVVIIDFGLAKAARARERMEDHCGTLWYYAPELVKGVPFLPVVE